MQYYVPDKPGASFRLFHIHYEDTIVKMLVLLRK